MVHRVISSARLAVSVLLLCASATSSAQQASLLDSLLGRWELKGRWASDAVSSIVELLPGGWYSQALVATSHLSYTYNGATLILVAMSQTGKPDSAVLNVSFIGDTLIGISSKDTVRLVRTRGGDFDGDIKGRWLLLTKAKENPVAQEFTADGEVRVFTTLSGEVGRYKVRGHEIEWQPMLPEHRFRRTSFKLEKDRLKLWVGSISDELSRLR